MIVGVQRARVVDDAIVVVLEQGIGDETSQNGLILVMVRVNEARRHDPVRGVDHFRVGLQVGADCSNLFSLNQHVSFLKIADVVVHSKDNAAFEQDAAAVGAASGGNRFTLCRHGNRARKNSGARLQETPPRHAGGRDFRVG